MGPRLSGPSQLHWTPAQNQIICMHDVEMLWRRGSHSCQAQALAQRELAAAACRQSSGAIRCPRGQLGSRSYCCYYYGIYFWPFFEFQYSIGTDPVVAGMASQVGGRRPRCWRSGFRAASARHRGPCRAKNANQGPWCRLGMPKYLPGWTQGLRAGLASSDSAV